MVMCKPESFLKLSLQEVIQKSRPILGADDLAFLEPFPFSLAGGYITRKVLIDVDRRGEVAGVKMVHPVTCVG